MMRFGSTRRAGFAAPALDAPPIAEPMRLEARTRVSIRARIRAERLSDDRSDAFRLFGDLELTGPVARVQFRAGDDRPAPGRAGRRIDRTLFDGPQREPVPERILRRTSREPSMLWIEAHGERGRPHTNVVCLGDCRHRPGLSEIAFQPRAALVMALEATALDARSGPTVTLAGQLAVPSGVFLRVWLASGCDPFGNPDDGAESVEFTLLSPGARFALATRRFTPGCGDACWVSLLVQDWRGSTHGNETTIGRCVPLES